MTDRALVLVDIQKDFMPDGALPAHSGHDVVPVANRLIRAFDLVVATQDWHPENHGSFASNHDGKSPGDIVDLDGVDQILWPDHCVQHTDGAEFADDLEIGRADEIFTKGTDPEIDSYSGFFDNDYRQATGMGEFLKGQGVDSIFVVGVATDYCVKYTAIDGCKLDFETWVVVDGCAGVGQHVDDLDQAFGEMWGAGAKLIDSGVLAAHL